MDQPIPDFETSHIDAERRRRRRRLLVPTGRTERAAYLNEIAKRLNPSLDFFAISLLAGLVLGAAILFDNPAIYVLAALLSPFMAPVVALGFLHFGWFGALLRSIPGQPGIRVWHRVLMRHAQRMDLTVIRQPHHAASALPHPFHRP